MFKFGGVAISGVFSYNASYIKIRSHKMARTVTMKNVEVSKDVHKKLSIVKATHEHKSMNETIQFLFDNQKVQK